MIRRLLLTAVVLMLPASLVAQTAPSPDALLKRAMQLEQVDGDLVGAVRQYQEIVDRYPDRRAVAAQALVRIGNIHERLGRTADAVIVYKRAEKDYADTQSAATARARVAALAESQARETVIWSGPEVGDVYSISPDGKRLAYLDMGQKFSVAIRDLSNGASRIIARGSDAGWAEEVVFSADGSKLAYAWAKNSAPYYEIRIVNVSGGEPRVVSNMAKGWLTLYDWSKDGRWIAVEMSPPGMINQHVVINVADGTQKVLKTVPRHAATEGMVFSPDSRYLAYDRPSDDNAAQRDVFLLPVDGGAEIAAATGPDDQAVAGWSPDGRNLLIQVTEGDTRTLVAQPMSKGAPSGPATTLRRGVRGWASGMTAAGAVLLRVNENPTTVYGAVIDVASGALTAASRLVAGESNRQPRFSRDGERIAFLSGTGGRVLSVQKLDTGQRTILPLPLRMVATYEWSPDGKSFLARAADLQGRQGVFQIDATTGNVTPLLLNSADARFFTPHWAADGRHFYYTKGLPRENRDVSIERDLQTGTERVVLDWSEARTADGSPVPPLRDHKVSPDGRYVVAVTRAAQEENGVAVWIASLADRSARQLLAVPGRQCCLPLIAHNALTWTADSQSVLINRAGEKPDDNRAIWMVPIDGSSPRRLGIDLPLPREGFAPHETPALHPDGKRIAFVVGRARTREIRLLENFLSPAVRRDP